MKKIITCFLGLSLLFSCTSSETETPDSNDDSLILPSKVITKNLKYNQTFIQTYKFDGEKLIEASNTDGVVVKYSYENNLLTKLVKTQSIPFSTTTQVDFTYANGKLNKYVVKDGDPATIYSYELTHNNDGTIKEVLNGASTAILTFKDGNLISDGKGGKYEYDAKNGGMKNIASRESFINIDFTGLKGVNNQTKMIFEHGSNKDVSTIEYTYNENSYPVSAKIYENGELISTSEFFY